MSCPRVLSGRNVHDRLLDAPMATGRAATRLTEDTEIKTSANTQKISKNQKNTHWNREETEEILQA